MLICDNCGNDYDKAFQVILDGQTYTFDSFECAANRLAPRCSVCQTPILGHGLESDGRIYCCAHFAKQGGASDLKDRT